MDKIWISFFLGGGVIPQPWQRINWYISIMFLFSTAIVYCNTKLPLGTSRSSSSFSAWHGWGRPCNQEESVLSSKYFQFCVFPAQVLWAWFIIFSLELKPFPISKGILFIFKMQCITGKRFKFSGYWNGRHLLSVPLCHFFSFWKDFLKE